MRSLWWLAVALAACGDVEKVPDAAVPDTYAPDSKTELTCTGGEAVCQGACTNMMTDEQHCGACGTQCAPTHGCAAGSCLPMTTCANIKAVDPMAASAMYTHPYTNGKFFCDMAGNAEITNLQMVLHAATPPTGFVQVRGADLAANTPTASAFIEIYNLQGGVSVPAQFAIGNCCMKIATGGTFLNMDNQYILMNTCQSPINAGIWRLTELATVWPQPLPADFFATNIVTEGANGSCGDTTNPMLIWQKKPF